jgi:hypothetical protein
MTLRAVAISVVFVAVSMISPRAQSTAPTSVPWTCFTAPGPIRTSASGISVTDAACVPQTPTIRLAPRVSSGTVTPLVVPSAPTRLSGSASDQNVALSWTAAAGEPIISYLLEAGSRPGQSDFGTFDTRLPVQSLLVTGLPANTYHLRVRAKTASGISAASNEVALVILPRDSCGSKPPAPKGIEAGVTGTTIVVAWGASGGECPVTSYIIEMGSADGLSDVGVIPTQSASTRYVIANAPTGSYVIAVRGVNPAGAGPATPGIPVTVKSLASPPTCSGIPGPPTQLVANVGSTAVTLTWDPAAGSVTSYVIEAGSAPLLSDLLVSDTGSLSTSSSLTAASGTYYLRLRARNACGTSSPSNEVRIVVTNTPTSPPVLTSMPLVQARDLAYQGSFRVPFLGYTTSSFEYGGSALAFNPARDSLFIVGHDWYQQVAEIAVPPVIVASTDVGALATATLLQPLTDATEGRLPAVNPGDPNPQKIGGLLPWAGRLYISAFSYYDGGATQVRSHFTSGTDLSVAGDVTGPWQVGTTVGAPVAHKSAGFVSGPMAVIPPEWQSALGGTVLTGQCCIAVVSRTSWGPAAFAIDPTQLGVAVPLPAKALVAYPAEFPLAQWGSTNSIYNGTTNINGIVFPTGTRSVLFFGEMGTGSWCYGSGTTNKALDGSLTSDGVTRYCYDPLSQDKGTHAYPYGYQVWAYDANDLARAAAGQIAPWDVRPYGVWPLPLPYGAAGFAHPLAAAYDPATGRIFLSQMYGDGNLPIIHVFKAF